MVDYRSSAVMRKHFPPDCSCLYRYGADDHQSTCPCSERERVLQLHIGKLEAALEALWAAYDPEDYLEGEDEDYGLPALLERKAWQRVAKVRHAAELVEGKP